MNPVAEKETVAMRMLNYSKQIAEQTSSIEDFCTNKLSLILEPTSTIDTTDCEKEAEQEFPQYFHQLRNELKKINNSLGRIADTIGRVAF